MRRAIMLSITLTLMIAGTLLSQERDRGDARRGPQRQQAAFQQVFTLRGVEFTQDQREKVVEIRTKYLPKLEEIQKKQQSIFTDEQMRARREAFRAAREAGKEGRALREAARAAIAPATYTEMENLMHYYLTHTLERGLNTPAFLRRVRQEPFSNEIAEDE